MKIFQGKYSLSRELAIVVAIKIILIFSLKLLFFSNPLDKQLKEQDLNRYILGATARPDSIR